MSATRSAGDRFSFLKLLAAACLAVGAALGIGAEECAAQQAAASPNAAANLPAPGRALVVAIRAYRETGSIAENGAGFVLAMTADSIYIATAAHVVLDRETRTFVVFEHARSDSLRANVSRRSADIDRLDLAILTVPRTSVPTRPFERFLDRRGDDLSTQPGDGVIPVGCPDGTEGCWTAPSPPDRILSQGALLSFQSTFVRPGSSGGALFNQDWEVIGMVVTDQPPRAEAIAIGDIVLQAEVWGIEPSLVPSRVPRAGYDVTVGASVALPSGGESRTPSGRIDVRYRLADRFSLVGGVLRFAPSDVGTNCPADRDRVACDAIANAVAVGMSLDLLFGRLGVHPQLEIGFAEVTGRWDSGGIFVDGLYEPIWNNEQTTGLAWGAALAVDYVIIPRVLIEALVGNWGVPDPFREVSSGAGLNAEFPGLYYGLGLRIGF